MGIKAVETGQVLEIACGNLMACPDLQEADILMLNTDNGGDNYYEFSRLLNGVKEGCRVFTYLDLRKVWQLNAPFPYRQLEVSESV